MKWLALLAVLLPGFASAYVSGVDDGESNLTPAVQARLDTAMTTYYRSPSPQKVETVLDIMNDTPLLRKKRAWPAVIGFLSVVFPTNKQHLFDWMSLHDYNLYAEDVFVSALMHANLRETALVFAQAHHWRKPELDRIRYGYDKLDLKHMAIVVPGHIDTLWGAFFGSGDTVYVTEIMDVLFRKDEPPPKDVPPSQFANLPLENKKLAEKTLKQYSAEHPEVRAVVTDRIAEEKDPQIKSYLKRIILGEPDK